MALSVDQKSIAEFLPLELIGKRKRCSRRSSFEDAADGPRLSNALLNLILLDTESDFWYQAKGQSGFFAESSDHFWDGIQGGKKLRMHNAYPRCQVSVDQDSFQHFFPLGRLTVSQALSPLTFPTCRWFLISVFANKGHQLTEDCNSSQNSENNHHKHDKRYSSSWDYHRAHLFSCSTFHCWSLSRNLGKVKHWQHPQRARGGRWSPLGGIIRPYDVAILVVSGHT